jgi:hypothetical protein
MNKITAWFKPIARNESSQQSSSTSSSQQQQKRPTLPPSSSGLSELDSTPTLDSEDERRITANMPSLQKHSLQKVAIEDSDGDDSDELVDISEVFAPLHNVYKASANSHRARHAAPPVKRTYKFSVDDILARVETEQVSNAVVQSLKDEMEQTTALAKLAADQAAADPSLFSSFVGDEESTQGMAKLRGALNRTDALNAGLRYSFFQARTPKSQSPRASFERLQKTRPRIPCTKNEREFRRAAMSGELLDVLRLLPNTEAQVVLGYILQELTSETNTFLRQSYLTILERFADSCYVDRPSVIEDLFADLDASPDALKVSAEIKPVSEIVPISEIPYANLVSVLKALTLSAKYLARKQGPTLIIICCRLILDKQVVSDIATAKALRDCYSAAVDSFLRQEDPERNILLVQEVYRQIEAYPSFQQQLLSFLPSHTPRLHDFRRMLAIMFFYSDISLCEGLPLSSPGNSSPLSSLLEKLQSPTYKISPSTDYVLLTSRINLLDLIIDDGVPSDYSSAFTSSSSTAPPKMTKEHEVAHNKAVDELAEAIKHIADNIRDTGLSFIGRAEAKNALERVRYRLMYGVRTKERRKLGIFDESLTNRDVRRMFQS